MSLFRWRLPLQAEVDQRGDLRQPGRVVGCLPERAKDQRRRLHGRKPLALHIGDDQPDRLPGRDDVIQVAADQRRGAHERKRQDTERSCLEDPGKAWLIPLFDPLQVSIRNNSLIVR